MQKEWCVPEVCADKGYRGIAVAVCDATTAVAVANGDGMGYCGNWAVG